MIQINKDNNKNGRIHISEDVMAIIAGTAALENEGVKGAVGNMAGEIVEKLGVKNFSKGVKITFLEDEAIVDLALVIKSDYKIQDVSEDVQNRVKVAIETMTGLHVSQVNINVQSLSIDKIKETEDK